MINSLFYDKQQIMDKIQSKKSKLNKEDISSLELLNNLEHQINNAFELFDGSSNDHSMELVITTLALGETIISKF